MSTDKKELLPQQSEDLINTLQTRFAANMNRHKDLDWAKIRAKLQASPAKLWSLDEMEVTGGEPDVVDYDSKTDEYIFFDCAAESPKGRRSLCYDRQALDSRKEHKPKDNVVDMAANMGIVLLDEQQYRYLHQFGKFDSKTSSWIKTPANIRKLGGAIFADYRFETIFIYHNGAESYYGGRAFRGALRV